MGACEESMEVPLNKQTKGPPFNPLRAILNFQKAGLCPFCPLQDKTHHKFQVPSLAGSRLKIQVSISFLFLVWALGFFVKFHLFYIWLYGQATQRNERKAESNSCIALLICPEVPKSLFICLKKLSMRHNRFPRGVPKYVHLPFLLSPFLHLLLKEIIACHSQCSNQNYKFIKIHFIVSVAIKISHDLVNQLGILLTLQKQKIAIKTHIDVQFDTGFRIFWDI